VPQDPPTEERRELREFVRTLACERIAPRAAEIDESAAFPWNAVKLAGAALGCPRLASGQWLAAYAVRGRNRFHSPFSDASA
jgi:hypothetical protein